MSNPSWRVAVLVLSIWKKSRCYVKIIIEDTHSSYRNSNGVCQWLKHSGIWHPSLHWGHGFNSCHLLWLFSSLTIEPHILIMQTIQFVNDNTSPGLFAKVSHPWYNRFERVLKIFLFFFFNNEWNNSRPSSRGHVL